MATTMIASALYGLLIRETGHKRGQFRRIGLLTIRIWDSSYADAVQEAIENDTLASEYPCERYDDRKHTITLV